MAGHGIAPRLILSYVRGLPDTSLYHAVNVGGETFYGWGQDRHLLADIYDALSFNTEATGNWSKPPKIPNWPRPTASTPKDSKPRTVAELWKKLGGVGRK